MRVYRLALVALFTLAFCSAASSTPRPADEELDNAKFKVQLNAWISSPSGYFNGRGNSGYFDLNRDFGFGNYATFNGRLDWRFKRKHHILAGVTPVFSSRTTTLTRTIEWQGQTFEIGARTSANINSFIFSAGYQYDFARWRQGSIGLQAIMNLAFTDATLKATGTVGDGTGTVKANGSVLAPLPAVGPTFMWYLLPNSNKLYLTGNLTGMSFFGYGNFISGHGQLGYTISKHWAAQAGYLVGSRLSIHGSSDQIAIRLTQKGPVFGVEYRWGTR